MRRTLVAVLLVSALTVPFMQVGAQTAEPPPGFQACGATDKLVLVFLNTDLSKPDENNVIHATGRFFIQFQARGPSAMDIDALYFSFGKYVADANTCDATAATPSRGVTDGALIQNFRADKDWTDGFFVPVNTYNVPDGVYLAALSAYDAAGNEMVRYWAHAVVENGCDRPCSGASEAEHISTDKTIPWPMILPGDGVRFDGKDGLYIEIGEKVAEIKAYLGTHEGQKVLELTEIPAPVRDDDLAPDAPQSGQPSTVDCSATPIPPTTTQCAKPYGQAWEWPGVIGDEAVIRVRAVDLNGNVAEKVVHVGDPTIGGRVSGGLPELEFEIPSVDAETDENGRALWSVTYKSLNDDGVHGDVFVRNPDGTIIDSKFRARLTPNHVMMGGKEQRNGTVEIIAGPDVQPGSYDFHLVVNYLAGAERIEKSTPLKMTVADRSSDLDAEEETASEAGEQVESTRGTSLEAANTTVIVPEEIPKDTPGAPMVALLGFVAVAAIALRRK